MKDGNLRKELKRVYALIQFVGNHGTRHKNIHQLKDIPNFTTWELKTNHLRFYFLYGQGMMIISGGKKVDQKADISQLKSILKQLPNNFNDVHQGRIAGGS